MNRPWTSQEKLSFLVPDDRSELLGLEIGARDAPLLDRNHGPVLYADHLDTESLRKQDFGGLVSPDKVVQVDVVTGGKHLSEVLDRRVDYVVASHVAEHVPDLLGWLIDIHKILDDGGTLGLAIPDKRFTFDYFRSTSNIAEAVEAYLTPYKVPAIRQIFDSAWQSIQVDYTDIWSGTLPSMTDDASRKSRLRPALELVRRVAATREYNDAHCWVFTPMSFLDLVEQTVYMDLFPFTIESFAPTPQNGYEFLVVLRKANSNNRESVIASVESARTLINESSSEHACKLAIDFETGAAEEPLQKTQDRLDLLQDNRRDVVNYRQSGIFSLCKQVVTLVRRSLR